MPIALYDRQQLLDDVWSTPVSHLKAKYALSDAGIKKLCSRLQIPTPPRGYWAKLNAGKKVPAKPLLAEYTGHPHHLARPARIVSAGTSTDDPRLAAVLCYESAEAHRIKVPARLKDPHPFVQLTQIAVGRAELDQRGLPAVVGRSIHLRVSKSMQTRALLIADAFLKAMEKRGYQLSIDDQGIALIFHGLSYRLEFYESCKRVPYETTEADDRRRKAGHYVYTPPWSFTPSGVL